MDQSSLEFNADEDEQDEAPGANALPSDAQDRDSSSIHSPNFQLAAASNPVGDAARSADATRTNAAAGGDADAQTGAQSDALKAYGFRVADGPAVSPGAQPMPQTGSASALQDKGDISIQAPAGPQKIGTDPITAQLGQLVQQRSQIQNQGATDQAAIATGKQTLANIGQQLAGFDGIPQRLEAQMARYDPSLYPSDPDDPATQRAAAAYQTTRDQLAQYKAAHPEYNQILSQQRQLQAGIQQQQADLDARNSSINQNLGNQEYVRIHGTMPQDDTPAISDTDAPLSSIYTRAAEIAGQTGMPRSAAFSSALSEARAQGMTTAGGIPIDQQLQSVPPEQWLPQLTPPQMRQALAFGAITRAQMHGAIQAQAAAKDQAADTAAATADNGVGPVTDFAMRALSQTSGMINRAWEGAARYLAANPSVVGGLINPALGPLGALVGGTSNPVSAAMKSGLSSAADYTKRNAEGLEAMNRGQLADGLVNPKYNDSIQSGVANGIGMMIAFAPAELLAAVAAPAAGAGVVVTLLARAGRIALGMIPAALQLGTAESASAYDAAKAQGASEEDATKAGTMAAAKTLPQLAVYAVTGAGAGKIVGAILSKTAHPLVTGLANFFAGSLANLTASGIIRKASGLIKQAQGGVLSPTEGNFLPTAEQAVQDITFAGKQGFDAAHTQAHAQTLAQAHTNAFVPVAQDIVAGTDPTFRLYDRASTDATATPEVRGKSAEIAAQMRANAADFLRQTGQPQIAPGQTADPLAQFISDLHDKAIDLRAKLGTAQDAGSVGAGADHDALKATEDQLHQQTRQMLSRVPTDLQARIARAVAPEVDWDAASRANAADPTAHFATAELGNSLRDQAIPLDKQQTIRQTARANGVNPDIADLIANQAIGAKAVKDLGGVLRGRPIDPAEAEVLKNKALLHPSDPSNPSSPLNVTSDAKPLLPPAMQEAITKRPDLLPYAHVAKTPADALNLLARGGMKRMADTAARMIPEPRSEPTPRPAQAPASAGAVPQPPEQSVLVRKPPATEPPRDGPPQPSAAERIRDRIAGRLVERPRKVLEGRLSGKTPEEISAQVGITPERARIESEDIAKHVAILMRERGVSEEDIQAALNPKRKDTLAGALAPEHTSTDAEQHLQAIDNPRPDVREPSPAEKARHEIGARLVERPKLVLRGILEGRTPEEIGAALGLTPEKAVIASRDVALHVRNLLRERGFSPSEISDALKPRPEPSGFRQPWPSHAESIRDQIAANLIERPRKVLEGLLHGKTPEDMGAQVGLTPEKAKIASEEVAKHVANRMRERGVSPSEISDALKPRSSRSNGASQPPGRSSNERSAAGPVIPRPLPEPEATSATRSGESAAEQALQSAPARRAPVENRKAIAAQAARLQQQYAAASEANKPAIEEQYRTLEARAKIVDAVNEPNRDAKGQAFRKAVPSVINAVRQQVREFAKKFAHVFAGVDEKTEADGTGGVSYNKDANRLQLSWNEIHNSAGAAYSDALRAGVTVEEARDAATRKIRSILDEELRHVADVRANGDDATKALWESLPPEIQEATRRVYSLNDPTADLAEKSATQLGYEYKRILSQHTQTGAVSEMAELTKEAAERAAKSGKGGWVRAVVKSLQRMAEWLRGKGGAETARQLDALHAELAKITAGESGVANDAVGREEQRPAAGSNPKLEDRAPNTHASSPSASDFNRDHESGTLLDSKAAIAINRESNARQNQFPSSDPTGIGADRPRKSENDSSTKKEEPRSSANCCDQPPTRPTNSPHYSVIAESQLKPEDYQKSDGRHNQEANRQLYERMQADPEFAKELEDHYPGITKGVAPGPRGAYSRAAPTPDLTWHHEPKRPGVLQLTPKDQHQTSGPVQHSLHPNQKGGREIWGGGSDKR